MFSLLTRLIGRLSVGRKLILIYALDLTAVIFVSGILINEKFIAIITPPESEPTIAPQRPTALDQLTPVARLCVGYSVAVNAFRPT